MKMKIVTGALLGLLSFALLYLFIMNSDNKIAYVESNRLLVNYAGMKEASKAYQQKAVIWKSNIDTLRKELQLEIDKYEKEKNAMSSKEKELSEKLITTKQKQLIDYQRSIEEKAVKEDQEITDQVLDRVNAYIKKYGKENGYNLIMAATESGNIVYAEEAFNITDDVLDGLNREYNGQ